MMKISDLDSLQCLHGRAPAVATGVKRMMPTPRSSPSKVTATW